MIVVNNIYHIKLFLPILIFIIFMWEMHLLTWVLIFSWVVNYFVWHFPFYLFYRKLANFSLLSNLCLHLVTLEVQEFGKNIPIAVFFLIFYTAISDHSNLETPFFLNKWNFCHCLIITFPKIILLFYGNPLIHSLVFLDLNLEPRIFSLMISIS